MAGQRAGREERCGEKSALEAKGEADDQNGLDLRRERMDRAGILTLQSYTSCPEPIASGRDLVMRCTIVH